MTAPAQLCLTVRLPLRLVSENRIRRMHWARRFVFTTEQRRLTRAYLAGQRVWPLRLPVLVTLTRIGPRTLDGDNLQGACKAVRDGVADALGVDDGGEQVTFEYRQEKRGAREYGVIVEVREC